jgi:hypothetical protein
MNFLVLPPPLTKNTDGMILPDANSVPLDPEKFEKTTLKGATSEAQTKDYYNLKSLQP